MKRVVVNFADHSFINVPADRMEKEDQMFFVYNGKQLVCAVDISCVLSIHIGEKRDCE